METSLLVSIKGHPDRLIEPGGRLVIGRISNVDVVGLDEPDVLISRAHVCIRHDRGSWLIQVLAEKKWVDVQFGDRVELFKLGPPMPMPFRGSAVLLVPGKIRTHTIRLQEQGDAAGALEPIVVEKIRAVPETRTAFNGYTQDQRDALAAMLAGYLRPFPRYNPVPATRQAAARTLGITERAFDKRIDNVKEKIRDEEKGDGLYLDGDDWRHELALHMINNGIIGVDDLDRIDRRPR